LLYFAVGFTSPNSRYVAQAGSTCYTERRKSKREVRKVLMIAQVATENSSLFQFISSKDAWMKTLERNRRTVQKSFSQERNSLKSCWMRRNKPNNPNMWIKKEYDT
jgi:hypothetical protein